MLFFCKCAIIGHQKGHYQMIVDGGINGGGMILVVVDVESNHIVSQTPYRYDQIKKGSQIIGRPFTIEKSGQFDLILSNNATQYGEISNWTLSNIVILKIAD